MPSAPSYKAASRIVVLSYWCSNTTTILSATVIAVHHVRDGRFKPAEKTTPKMPDLKHVKVRAKESGLLVRATELAVPRESWSEAFEM